MTRIHRELKTNIIYVADDQTQAMTLVNKTVVMQNRRIALVGVPMELANTPVNQIELDFDNEDALFFDSAFQRVHAD